MFRWHRVNAHLSDRIVPTRVSVVSVNGVTDNQDAESLKYISRHVKSLITKSSRSIQIMTFHEFPVAEGISRVQDDLHSERETFDIRDYNCAVKKITVGNDTDDVYSNL